MIGRLRNWWAALSRREHVLLGVAALLAAALLLWQVGRPLVDAWTQAENQHRQALERKERIAAKIDLLRDMTMANRRVQNSSVPLDQWIAASAADRGLTIDRADARGDRQLNLSIAAAKAPALMAWLTMLEDQGVIVDQMTMTPAPDGTVGMTAELRRRGP